MQNFGENHCAVQPKFMSALDLHQATDTILCQRWSTWSQTEGNNGTSGGRLQYFSKLKVVLVVLFWTHSILFQIFGFNGVVLYINIMY